MGTLSVELSTEEIAKILVDNLVDNHSIDFVGTVTANWVIEINPSSGNHKFTKVILSSEVKQ